MFLVIFLNWSLVFFGTHIHPSHQFSPTPSKLIPTNIHLYPSDEINNNIARSRSTNLHNTYNTRHREKNRKNKDKNHYYIKHNYYPYNPTSSSSHLTSIIDDQYQYEMMSNSFKTQPYLTFILIVYIFNEFLLYLLI